MSLKNSYDDLSECPTCKGTKFYTYWESNKRTQELYGDNRRILFGTPCPDCNGGLAERVATFKQSSNIPNTFYQSDYKSFDWTIYKNNAGETIDLTNKKIMVENLLMNYAEWKKRGMGLYIISKTKGSGKTFLASCICNELMNMYAIRTRFVSAARLLDISQSGDKDSNDEYKREPIKLLCNCELLVIDDIGQKKTANEWMNDILFKIVDSRMTQKLVTIFTSNDSLQNLSLDDRIIDRISRITYDFRLPEYNVRSKEAYQEKLDFLKDMGLVGNDKKE